MFGLSFWEIAMILAVALLVLGPTKLPELAKSLGRGIREFRRATEDFKSTIDEELHKPDPPASRAQLPAENQGSEKVKTAVSSEMKPPEPPDAPTVERKPSRPQAQATPEAAQDVKTDEPSHEPTTTEAAEASDESAPRDEGEAPPRREPQPTESQA